MSSFHLCRQKDSMQCGIACLSMICHHYKKNYSIETLSKYCIATNQGVSLLGISKAANEVGLQTVCAKLSVNQLSQVKLPCIIHWNQNHFVVIYKVENGKKYSIADPGKGLLWRFWRRSRGERSQRHRHGLHHLQVASYLNILSYIWLVRSFSLSLPQNDII